MTPEEWLEITGGDAAGSAFELVTVDVSAESWVAVATRLRDGPRSDCDFFDWLSAYDDGGAGLAVVARVWSVAKRHGVVVRTHVVRDGGSLPTLTGIWPGAGWHERETHEMFGIDFAGHGDLRTLLLPDGFDGNPLRKEFVLASRVAKEWPGAKEPGESTPGRKRPLGVPGPGEWGSS
ncbi:MAG TPA: NADH-quinone oxidoreductase subunit C [Mycobacteriales bacterium]|nr:NADH-quinone oxidoreductase subunit C [Mycobacteriales bacterium]